MSLPGPLTDDRLRAAVLQAGTRLTEGHGESCDCATCLVVQPLVDAALAFPAPEEHKSDLRVGVDERCVVCRGEWPCQYAASPAPDAALLREAKDALLDTPLTERVLLYDRIEAALASRKVPSVSDFDRAVIRTAGEAYDRGRRDRNAELVPLLDVIDGIVDDTHPEGDGCPLCTALDELRALIEGEKP